MQHDSQLNLIFNVIGTPSADERSFLDASTAKLVDTLPQRDGVGWSALFPYSDESALKLLQQMLHFNPAQRCTADIGLMHEYFNGLDSGECAVAFSHYRSCRKQPIDGSKHVWTNHQNHAAPEATSTTTAEAPSAAGDIQSNGTIMKIDTDSDIDASPRFHPQALDAELEIVGESPDNIRESVRCGLNSCRFSIANCSDVCICLHFFAYFNITDNQRGGAIPEKRLGDFVLSRDATQRDDSSKKRTFL